MASDATPHGLDPAITRREVVFTVDVEASLWELDLAREDRP